MKILDAFYIMNSGGFTQLVEYEGQYYVGWQISDSIESDEFNYAFWVFTSLKEAEEKFNELLSAEMAWR